MRIAALAALLLISCTKIETEGPDAQGYKWAKEGSVAPAVYHRGVDVYLNCGVEPSAKSCAIQGRGDGLCHIYLPPNPEPWQQAHEEKHCNGWIHPNNLHF